MFAYFIRSGLYMSSAIYLTRAQHILSLLIPRCAIFLACLATFGCVEVAPDRGVVYGSPDRAQRTGIREVLVTVQVVDKNKRALPNINVTAETQRGKDSGTTNSKGEALLHTEVAQFERVDFFFESGGSTSSYTVESMPKGLDSFRAVFQMTAHDGIQLVSTEY